MVPSPQSQKIPAFFQLHYKVRWKKSYCTVAVNNEGTLTLLNQLPMQSYKGQRVTRLLKMYGGNRNYSIETAQEQTVAAFQQTDWPFKSFSVQNVLLWPFSILLANNFSTHQLYELWKLEFSQERDVKIIWLYLHQEWCIGVWMETPKHTLLILFSFDIFLRWVIKRQESHSVLK